MVWKWSHPPKPRYNDLRNSPNLKEAIRIQNHPKLIIDLTKTRIRISLKWHTNPCHITSHIIIHFFRQLKKCKIFRQHHCLIMTARPAHKNNWVWPAICLLPVHQTHQENHPFYPIRVIFQLLPSDRYVKKKNLRGENQWHVGVM